MKIIVESGATKSDWRLFDDRGVQLARSMHGGTNVSSMSMKVVKEVISEGISSLVSSLPVKDGMMLPAVDSFELYTAGVVTDAIRQELDAFVHGLMAVGTVDVNDDLVGAARALYGSGSGVVAILGTGSNSCFYDGADVHRRVYSGGFILGDEGGAAALGRLFIADYIKNLVPPSIAEEFSAAFDVSYDSIVGSVYRGDAPAAYLGSFAPFIVARYSDPYIRELVDGNFRSYIERSLLRYDGVGKGCPVGVVGGFGYACREIFGRIAAEYGIVLSGFLPSPIDGLGRRTVQQNED